jgi:hypothetical protein
MLALWSAGLWKVKMPDVRFEVFTAVRMFFWV